MQSQKGSTHKSSEAIDLNLMQHPERWPGLVLPVKHRTERDGAMPVCGFMFEDVKTQQAAPTIYIGLIYFQSMGIKFKDLPIRQFNSLEAVVAAGWMVD